MEEKINVTAWLARDKVENRINLYLYKPTRNPKGWWYLDSDKCKGIDENLFPQVKWEDEEPTKVELTINYQSVNRTVDNIENVLESELDEETQYYLDCDVPD